MMEQKSVLPWEQPEIAGIIAIFGGKVTDIRQVDVTVRSANSTEVDDRYGKVQ